MRTSRRLVEAPGTFQCLWRNPQATAGFSTGVSLHSHTLHSRESMDFVPRVLGPVPLARAALRILDDRHRRLTGRPIPFARVFWQPPLQPRTAYELEARQILDLLGLRPMVSLTDHDNLEACAELQAIGIRTPYSLEWTVPYHQTVFHIGVHNLPADQARSLIAAMAESTEEPKPSRIRGLLADMDAASDVLLVLNHPFSNEERVDRGVHVRLLMDFLAEYGGWIHALELNGLQPASDNRDVIRLAAERNLPVVSGGDRHCAEPGANVNLTNASSFAEFVHEIRRERASHVLFLPQYRDPIPARYIEFIWQAVRVYPDAAGRERWVDRVFLERENGEVAPLAAVWPAGGPAVIRAFIAVVGFLAAPGMRTTLCLAIGRRDRLEAEGL